MLAWLSNICEPIPNLLGHSVVCVCPVWRKGCGGTSHMNIKNVFLLSVALSVLFGWSPHYDKITYFVHKQSFEMCIKRIVRFFVYIFCLFTYMSFLFTFYQLLVYIFTSCLHFQKMYLSCLFTFLCIFNNFFTFLSYLFTFSTVYLPI